MKLLTVLEAVPEVLERCLSDVPFARLINVESTLLAPYAVLAQVEVAGRRRQLVVDVQTNGQPRIVRETARRLNDWTTSGLDAYGVVIAPYVSDEGAAIARQAGIGYADLAGNCRLCFENVYVQQSGRPNPFQKKRDLAGLYSPRTSRVLRVLLSAPKRQWRLVPLAETAEVSLGLVSGVRRRLLEREWAKDMPDGLALEDPEALLRDWATQYSYRNNKTGDFYSVRPPQRAGN